MKSQKFTKHGLICCCLLGAITPCLAQAAPFTGGASAQAEGYVANKDGLKVFFDALSSRLGKPVIVSKLAARKQVSGEFDLSDPQALLEEISQQLGLIWYHDGQAVYVYDGSEMRNSVIALDRASYNALENFLLKSKLLDPRYPLRGDEQSSAYYISGPPFYVDVVLNSAKFITTDDLLNSSQQSSRINFINGLGESGVGPDGQKAAVIHLHNAFVGDRSYEMRGEKIVIPGIATVIDRLLSGGENTVSPEVQRLGIAASPAPAMSELDTEDLSQAPVAYRPKASLAEALRAEAASSPISIIANPNTNSLLVKGTPRQVELVANLVRALDKEKRHVELSLWIVDLQKEDLDQLGVNWEGNINVGNQLGVSFNGGSYTTLDGARFVASVQALSQKKRADIVSRPVILTQENVPAIFDHNRTFYTQLLGERKVELQHVTYGTMVNVLPRFSADGQIEMVLNIEDGNEIPNATATESDFLPRVGRTHISTVARVPKGKSLLVGGYTRDEISGRVGKIPVLGSIPLIGGLFRYKQDNQSNTVRIFLIQPREINDALESSASDVAKNLFNGRRADSLPDWSRNFLDNLKWR